MGSFNRDNIVDCIFFNSPLSINWSCFVLFDLEIIKNEKKKNKKNLDQTNL